MSRNSHLFVLDLGTHGIWPLPLANCFMIICSICMYLLFDGHQCMETVLNIICNV